MRQRCLGFTLIEVLVVVAIMGLLAAIVLPQFATSTDDAKRSTLDYNLRVLRQQIEFYKAEHDGLCPKFAKKTLEQLTTKTDIEGNKGTACGPYIYGNLPMNPFNVSNKVKAGNGSGVVAGGNTGWQYHEATGRIWPNNSEWWFN